MDFTSVCNKRFCELRKGIAVDKKNRKQDAEYLLRKHKTIAASGIVRQSRVLFKSDNQSPVSVCPSVPEIQNIFEKNQKTPSEPESLLSLLVLSK